MGSHQTGGETNAFIRRGFAAAGGDHPRSAAPSIDTRRSDRKEFRTPKLIREKLAELGVDEIQSPVPTAVIGLIQWRQGTGQLCGIACRY